MQLEKLGRWIKATPETLPKTKRKKLHIRFGHDIEQVCPSSLVKTYMDSNPSILLHWLDEQEGYFLTKERMDAFLKAEHALKYIAQKTESTHIRHCAEQYLRKLKETEPK